MTADETQIRIKKTTAKKLAAIGKKCQSYNDIIEELLK